MRPILALAAVTLLTGCAANEYSQIPEPSGEWIAANPPGLTADPAPAPLPLNRSARRRMVRSYWASRGAVQ